MILTEHIESPLSRTKQILFLLFVHRIAVGAIQGQGNNCLRMDASLLLSRKQFTQRFDDVFNFASSQIRIYWN